MFKYDMGYNRMVKSYLHIRYINTGLGKSLPSPQIPSQGFVGWDMGFVGFVGLPGLSLINLKYYIFEKIDA